MKAITLCLLVLVSATCLLTTRANSIASGEETFDLGNEFDFEYELDQLLDELDNDNGYMDVEEFGFIGSCRKILRKALKTVRGTNCIIKEVVDILSSCTTYVDAIDACGTAVPKDVAKIVSNVKDMIKICNDILHLHSQLCSDNKSVVQTASKCFWQLFKASMKLTRKINVTLKLIAKLPADTSSCFLNATNDIKVSFNSFLPNINVCIDSM